MSRIWGSTGGAGRLLAVLLAVVAAGCGGGGGGAPSSTSQPPDGPPANLRPAGSPDVVVLSVSGRCGLGILCTSPVDNEPYLGDFGDAAEAVRLSFQQAGHTTDYADFIASFYSYDDDNDGQSDRLGFLELVDTLDWIEDNWISDFDNPTRIVIVAHSHGCV